MYFRPSPVVGAETPSTLLGRVAAQPRLAQCIETSTLDRRFLGSRARVQFKFFNTYTTAERDVLAMRSSAARAERLYPRVDVDTKNPRCVEW